MYVPNFLVESSRLLVPVILQPVLHGTSDQWLSSVHSDDALGQCMTTVLVVVLRAAMFCRGKSLEADSETIWPAEDREVNDGEPDKSTRNKNAEPASSNV
jgi:hypothetical protein